MRRGIRTLSVTALAALVAGLTQVALTAPTAQAAVAANDYCAGQCSDILPPGENGNATLADILAHKVFGTRPAHASDQLTKYNALSSNYKTLTTGTINQFFNDSSFGVAADQVASTASPRSDVTIVRDKA